MTTRPTKTSAGPGTEVLYVRVPTPLKDAVERHAQERSLTQTMAVVELLERGLEAVSNETSIATLQAEATSLRDQLDRARRLQERADAQARAAAEREQGLLAAYQALGQRTEQRVGTCPNPACGGPVNGYDLLVTGKCPRCGQGLAALLAKGGNGLDQSEFLFLIGAVGVLVGIALLAKGR